MTKRWLLAITGAFHLDGGIAAVNRLVIHTLGQRGLMLDVLVLNEAHDAALDSRYVAATQATYRTFSGDKLGFTAAVWAALLRCRYDYVMFDHINLASVVAPLRWVGRCRYSVWVFGVEVFPPKPDWQGRLGLRGADKILAISDFTRAMVVQKSLSLPPAVCELALDPIRHRNMLPPQPETCQPQIDLVALDGRSHRLGPRCVLHVGRMMVKERYKGQESLLLAFPAISARFPDAQLVLAGQGDDYEYLRAKAELLPATMHGQVFMPGFVESELLNQLYHACYLFAMPSIGEGFGLVYLEAMSRAKPCIGGNTDATPFVIEDGVTGLLVDDPRSPGQLAQAILQLMQHPEQARAMGMAGYQRVRTRFLFPHFMERFCKIVGME